MHSDSQVYLKKGCICGLSAPCVYLLGKKKEKKDPFSLFSPLPTNARLLQTTLS